MALSLPSWLTVTPQSGSKNGEIQVTATEHTGRLSRSFTITGKTAHGTTKSLNISQNAAAESINIKNVTIGETKASFASGKWTGTVEAKNAATIKIYFTSNSKNLFLTRPTGEVFTGGTVKLYSCDISNIMDSPTGTLINKTEAEGIPDDPGAANMCGYYFEITDISESQTTIAYKFDLIVTNMASFSPSAVTGDALISITRKPGRKTYSVPVVTSITYKDVPASGSGSAALMPTVAAQQTWGWNGATSGGGTIDSGFTFTYAKTTTTTAAMKVDAANGGITGVISLGTTEKVRSKLDTVSVIAEANGETSAAKTVDVYQAANTPTYAVPTFVAGTGTTIGTGNAVTINWSADTHGIQIFETDGSGVFKLMKQTATYTSGESKSITADAAALQTGGAFSGTVESLNEVDGFRLSGTAIQTKQVAVTQNFTVVARNGFKVKVSATMNGKSTTSTITFNQAAGGSTISFSPESVTFEYNGGSRAVQVTSNDDWTIEIS